MSPRAYDEAALPNRSYTAAEVDAALAALIQPGRLRHAQDVVTHAAPTLQRMLAEALAEGGWFGEAHDAEISRAVSEHDQGERVSAVSTLVAEQTRLGMFVGVAVGFELANELAGQSKPGTDKATEKLAGQREPDMDEAATELAGQREPDMDEAATELAGQHERGLGEAATELAGEPSTDQPGAWKSQTQPPTEEH